MTEPKDKVLSIITMAKEVWPEAEIFEFRHPTYYWVKGRELNGWDDGIVIRERATLLVFKDGKAKEIIGGLKAKTEQEMLEELHSMLNGTATVSGDTKDENLWSTDDD